MSRTYKDCPFRLVENEARSNGFVRHVSLGRGSISFDIVNVSEYVYSHRHNFHAPIRRRNDYRQLEDEWESDYGNKTLIRNALHNAVSEYNSGCLDEDWDDPNVYQRRRQWHLYQLG